MLYHRHKRTLTQASWGLLILGLRSDRNDALWNFRPVLKTFKTLCETLGKTFQCKLRSPVRKGCRKSLHYRSQPQDQHPQKLPVPSAQPLPCASSMFKHVQASDKYLNLDLQTGHGTSWPHQIAWFLDVLGPIMIIMRCGTFPGRIRKDKPWKKARCNGQLSSNHKHQKSGGRRRPKAKALLIPWFLGKFGAAGKVMSSQQKFRSYLDWGERKWIIIHPHSSFNIKSFSAAKLKTYKTTGHEMSEQVKSKWGIQRYEPCKSKQGQNICIHIYIYMCVQS